MSSSQKSTRLSRLTSSKRIVVKIGSSLLLDANRAQVRQEWLLSVIEDVMACRRRGQDVVIVSSGATALGRHLVGITDRALSGEESQAAAACGQVRLMEAYQHILSMYGAKAAQLLLTFADTENRQSYLNVRSSLCQLLEWGVIPIINENDVVASPVRRYGDNDRLAARIATMIEADCLILLSDIDGLFTADPSIDPRAEFIDEIKTLSSDILSMAGESRSGFGRGGMRTKIEAARIALAGGCAMIIARGNMAHPLRAIEGGGRFSLFLPQDTPAAARKRWISGSLDPRGAVVIDDGACRALKKGGSLLAVGIKEIEGTFLRGDLVRVLSLQGAEIARGLTSYSSDDLAVIKGQRSDKFAELLGVEGAEEAIHRDNLALMEGQ